MVTLDFERTASFDVDAQNTFTPLCPNELPVEGGNEIVSELNAQALKAKYRLGSKDAHSPLAIWVADDNHMQYSSVESDSPDVDIHWNKHAILGTYGFELLDGLPHPRDYDYFVWKGIEPDQHPYGACYHDLSDKRTTGVIEFLKCNDVVNVIVGGLATDFCVKTTALQLKKVGFNVIVNLGASRGIAKETIVKAKDEMLGWGIVLVDSEAEIKDKPTSGYKV